MLKITGNIPFVEPPEWAVLERSLIDLMNDAVMVDLRNIYNPDEMVSAGFDYHCIGRPTAFRM